MCALSSILPGRLLRGVEAPREPSKVWDDTVGGGGAGTCAGDSGASGRRDCQTRFRMAWQRYTDPQRYKQHPLPTETPNLASHLQDGGHYHARCLSGAFC